jgi:hypothetical protein
MQRLKCLKPRSAYRLAEQFEMILQPRRDGKFVEDEAETFYVVERKMVEQREQLSHGRFNDIPFRANNWPEDYLESTKAR